MSSFPPFHVADFPGEVTLDHIVPGAAAQFAPLPSDLRPELTAALAARGIQRLYTHQADAYHAVRNGRHLVVVTPTASGKTLCYNLPVVQRLLEDPDRRALYLFPTKALAQDQLAELSALKQGLPIELRVDTDDGDTAPGRRTAIKEGGHVVMTNPDMLHTGILPHHTRWRRLFSSLEFVVIDELQTYRGPLDPIRRADHRLLPQPSPGRGDAQLSPARPRPAPRRQPTRARISRRVPPAAPPRDRGRPSQRRHHRGRQHERAGARHRHRQPADRNPGRLSRHHRVDLAAAWSSRAAFWLCGRARRFELAAGPVHRPP